MGATLPGARSASGAADGGGARGGKEGGRCVSRGVKQRRHDVSTDADGNLVFRLRSDGPALASDEYNRRAEPETVGSPGAAAGGLGFQARKRRATQAVQAALSKPPLANMPPTPTQTPTPPPQPPLTPLTQPPPPLTLPPPRPPVRGRLQSAFAAAAPGGAAGRVPLPAPSVALRQQTLTGMFQAREARSDEMEVD